MEEVAMSFRKSQLCLLVVALLSGCGTSGFNPSLSDFDVISHGADPGGDFCRDFNLTAADAKGFFAKAEVVDAMQLHDRFNHLPCWVRGTAHDARGTWQWEVRAGGTAWLSGPAGTTVLLACSTCEEFLTGNEEPPSQ
jgi:hypothetical protein